MWYASDPLLTRLSQMSGSTQVYLGAVLFSNIVSHTIWQMLLPCGRWNSHYRVGVLADFIAMWQME